MYTPRNNPCNGLGVETLQFCLHRRATKWFWFSIYKLKRKGELSDTYQNRISYRSQSVYLLRIRQIKSFMSTKPETCHVRNDLVYWLKKRYCWSLFVLLTTSPFCWQNRFWRSVLGLLPLSFDLNLFSLCL